ncbi:succinate dehydrogenase/fumarate reductase flavoprotein subunit [Nocardia tenerifensis]|uniref:Succinate dehydrogenase/fumarate reductase flavoprotein subunit n=1 Tax=Nocardia tenerifensis TaxID=228006 RepID=A0A318JYP9_9NOCA|nr:FAD-dependent oxidoreductase [Nocardia tenerifensis]PXX59218.1 succinate dehydrogenase/fumarate reductase flavoprotein subunit [Nocardia tenerifensis]
MIEADVVVIGSGAAGLAAALAAADGGAEVVVLEASARWGGSTAVSGGQVWAPANHRMHEAGYADTVEEALTYCRAAAPGRDDTLVETFVRTVPEVVRFLEARSPIRFIPVPAYPDTFAELPGGKTARHVEVAPQDLGDLGELAELVWPAPFFAPVLTNQEILERNLFAGGPTPMDLITQRMSAGAVALGAGLVVGLLHGCRKAGVRLFRDCRATELITDERGRIIGVRTESAHGDVRAGRGVVLACGGFEHDPILRSQLLSGPLTHPVTPPVQHGDGLRMAGRVGAAMAYLGEYWSWPACQMPGRAWPDAAGTPQPQLAVLERSLPHVLWVNGAGRRFVNESSHNCASAFAELDPNTHHPRNLPAWAIGDAQFRAKYSVAGIPAGTPAPEWLIQADSLAELAERIDVDPIALEHTVTRFNTMAEAGRDDDFQRGRTRYEHAFGDPAAAHPNLGPVCAPPFFAVPVYPGAVGTKGGPRTDRRARVLDWSGAPIAGLYAAGNAAAAVFGPGTFAGGLTIASALTWGWIAGRDLADPR